MNANDSEAHGIVLNEIVKVSSRDSAPPLSARLVEDLDLDSLAFLELILTLEDSGGFAFTPDLLDQISTVGDLCEWFAARRASEHTNDGERMRVLGPNRVDIRPVELRDYDFLYRLHMLGGNWLQFRTRGGPVPPDRFGELLWRNVLTQQLVIDVNTGQPLGLVVAYAPDLEARVASLAAGYLPGRDGFGWRLEGVVSFISYLFRTYDLRKIYLEVPEFNRGTIGRGLERFFSKEGNLRSHEYVAGRYWDMEILSLDGARLPVLLQQLSSRFVASSQ